MDGGTDRYTEQNARAWDEIADVRSRRFPDAEFFATEPKFEFIFPLGDVVTAMIDAGMRIQSLREYPAEHNYRFGPQVANVERLPGSYVLVAQRERG